MVLGLGRSALSALPRPGIAAGIIQCVADAGGRAAGGELVPPVTRLSGRRGCASLAVRRRRLSPAVFLSLSPAPQADAR